MNGGSILATFLVVFRETLEASLIVGIILTALAKLNQRRFFPHVTASVVLAIMASVITGFVLATWTKSAQGNVQKMIEGSISLLACSVLTYMVFWMNAQARKMRSEMELRIEQAVTGGEYFAILTLPFLAVFREGAETVLFLKAVSIQNSGVVSLWGGLSGSLVAILLAYLLFVGGRKIPIRTFFKVTEYFILLISAGLLAYGIHELEELGWISPIVYPVWNINHVLNEKQGIGAFLKALFGYNGNPSLVEVTLYWMYLSIVFLLLKKPIKIISHL
ncbi:MAG: FTR1 family iron permease [Candidatus Omnitrophica bacterium]|nr:FTR1 family iron permease [Candidatus Omnitrophota bacterium]